MKPRQKFHLGVATCRIVKRPPRELIGQLPVPDESIELAAKIARNFEELGV